MPSMGGSATLISAPHLGDLLDVDMTGKADQSIPSWQAGAAKYEPLPGVVGDGADGLQLGGGLVSGVSPAVVNLLWQLYGRQAIQVDGSGTTTGITALSLTNLGAPAHLGNVNPLIDAERVIDRANGPVLGPLLFVGNYDGGDGSHPPMADEIVLHTETDAGTGLETNNAGGLGLFGHVPPTAQPAITGALSTVADAPAKAVLTSIIAALVGCGLASDGTT